MADNLPADVFRADGVTKLGTAVIDFRSGIVCSFTSDQVLPRFDEPLILRTKTGEFQAVWEEGPCRHRTLRLVNSADGGRLIMRQSAAL